MIARKLLPEFGGTPAVWSTCLLFFQTLLLAGYIYAHGLPNGRAGQWVHVALLAASAIFLPIALRGAIGAGGPTRQILLLLAISVGGPYFLLSSTAPLIQRWFAVANPSESPWRLYALSNFGSFLALLSYPFAIEPFVRLGTQMRVWSGVYALFLLACAWTAITSPSKTVTQDAQDTGDRVNPWQVLLWLGLSATGSIILLAATNEISQEIAVNPFLWVAPLSLYLLTFVLTFESDRWYRPQLYAGLAGFFVAIACGVTAAANAVPILWQLAVHLATLFFTCMLCNGELVRTRPAPRHLTAFYLTIAAGGALGGVFVALIAPRVFTEFSEYPIGLGLACILGLVCWIKREGLAAWKGLDVRVPLSSLLLGAFTAIAYMAVFNGQATLISLRNFYGILRVTAHTDMNGPFRTLTHGRIDHGFQYQDAAHRDWPTSYYGPHSGVALAINALHPKALRLPRRIAVVGLGTGTLAAWGKPGDEFRFYEINPNVIALANSWFTFLKDSPARVETVLGDARVQLSAELARGASHDFDAIAVNAFSSDSIPMHLLTAECADIYRARLKPGGILLLHITNRTLDLEPVARGVAEHLGWQASQLISSRDSETGESSSQWVVIGADILPYTQATGWAALTRPPLIWTDDFASLWHVLKF